MHARTNPRPPYAVSFPNPTLETRAHVMCALNRKSLTSTLAKYSLIIECLISTPLSPMDITGFLFGNVNEEGELEDETLLDKVSQRLFLIRVHVSIKQ